MPAQQRVAERQKQMDAFIARNADTESLHDGRYHQSTVIRVIAPENGTVSQGLLSQAVRAGLEALVVSGFDFEALVPVVAQQEFSAADARG